MKVAFYIEDGLEQIVLTPQNDHEKRMMDLIHRGDRQFEIKRGSFYACQGGWTRHSTPFGLHDADRSDDSTIVVIRPAPSRVATIDDFASLDDGSPSPVDSKATEAKAHD